MLTDEGNSQTAAEIVVLVTSESGEADHIALLDTSHGVAQTFDQTLARAVGMRMIELAATLPRPLKRFVEVDDHLRGLDG